MVTDADRHRHAVSGARRTRVALRRHRPCAGAWPVAARDMESSRLHDGQLPDRRRPPVWWRARDGDAGGAAVPGSHRSASGAARSGVPGDAAAQDSFVAGLLDCPHYTGPERLEGDGGERVPEVLMSGHHEDIRRWRLMQSLGRTKERRPALLEGRTLTREETELLAAYSR